MVTFSLQNFGDLLLGTVLGERGPMHGDATGRLKLFLLIDCKEAELGMIKRVSFSFDYHRSGIRSLVSVVDPLSKQELLNVNASIPPVRFHSRR